MTLRTLFFLVGLSFCTVSSIFGQTTVNLSYSGLSGEINGTCSVAYQIYGEMPSPRPPSGRGPEFIKGGRGPGGKYPIALYIPGTNEPFKSNVAMAFVRNMRMHGFAAFVLAYPRRTDSGCAAITNKAACMFNSASSSALSVIAQRLPRTDPTRVVVAGISQGAQIAVISGNENPNVKAAWAMGVGNILSLGSKMIPMQSCMNAANHRLKSMQIFAGNAYNDGFFDLPTVHEELQGVTGNTNCAATYHNSNGSGCETISMASFQAGDGHIYPFSDFMHWSGTTTIDWGLPHIAEWLCNMASCNASVP
jgi:hypothetical protein